jgi:hypothetical protein
VQLLPFLAALALVLVQPAAARAAGAQSAQAPFTTQGIYLQQYTAQDPERLNHLINNALEVGINTFVVDLWSQNPAYEQAVRRIHEVGIRFVPRVVMFADGGSHEQIINQAHWEKRWRLVKYALKLGAKDIQLDYIRYASKTPASPNNALYVRNVVQFFKQRVNAAGAELQIDIFGEAAHAPSAHIGQDMGLLAPHIDAVCPMVYPSHYKPYAERSQLPYETVFDSLIALKRQLGHHPVDVYAYIELNNHRYPMSVPERVRYIRAQLRAVREAHAEGWLAWSAGNKYDLLFDILRRFKADVSS